MKEDNLSMSQNSSINGKTSKRKSKKKLSVSKSIKNAKYKSQSNKNNRLNDDNFERSESSSLFNKESKSLNYKEELYKTFSNFLYIKKFKLSNEFDARHSKKFLEQKNKYLEKIVLSDVIEKDDNNTLKDSIELNNKDNKRRKSGTQKNLKNYFSLSNPPNYCIIISNYDDDTIEEKKFNFTVKNDARKLNNNLKKNKNLSKYYSNNEAKNNFLDV